MRPERVYLIGLPGSGKTTLGRALAVRWRYAFADLDARVEAAADDTVAALFARAGEAAFRERERDALRQTAAQTDVVVATGGGTPCFFDNLAWMKVRGLVVFLDVPVPTLAARLAEDTTRPLLADSAPAARLRTLRTDRLPYYQQAHLTVGGNNPDINTLLNALGNYTEG